jgi:hypothetical protein
MSSFTLTTVLRILAAPAVEGRYPLARRGIRTSSALIVVMM